MAISPRMLAIIQKVENAEAEYFAGLRTKAIRDRLRAAKVKQVLAARKKPPVKKAPLRAK
ncbi:MAG TPA: hypothetical protein VL086_02145 [Candidatus Nitrosotalea sp.]|nr:hypothetical protein [Candidatus Nitrosotalea sp.]